MQIYCATQQMRCLNLCVKETIMDRPTYVYNPVQIAAYEREGRRLRDEYVAGLIRKAWQRLFRRAPVQQPQIETSAQPARA